MRGSTVEVNCKWCKQEFTARIADRKRGWAKYCSKSCKAKEQENRTGQYRSYVSRVCGESHDRYAPQTFHATYSNEGFDDD